MLAHYISFLLAVVPSAMPALVPQKRGVITAPAWFTAKWTYDDREFRSIRVKLDGLWMERPTNVAVIEGLYQKNVLPHRDEYARARSGKINPKNYYWLVALESYFGHLGILSKYKARKNVGYMLGVAPPPPSYEFARVAFGIYVADGLYRMKDFSLADRLLAKWPFDPLVRKDTVRLGTMISGSTTSWKRSLKMAEELNAEFPKQADVFLINLQMATYMAWRITSEATYLRRTVKVLDEILAHKEPYFLLWHDTYLRKKQQCEREAKEAGIKL